VIGDRLELRMKVGDKLTKILRAMISSILILLLLPPSSSFATEKPIVDSFTMTPDSVDTSLGNSVVSFNLKVDSQNGILSTQAIVTLTDGGMNSVSIPLLRSDSPIIPTLTQVEFSGSFQVPSNFPSGVYSASTSGIIGLTPTGTAGYSTGTIFASSTSRLAGAPNSLLIRKNGDLNFNYATFVGPSFNRTIGLVFNDSRYNNVPSPIWRVGESFNPIDYYELRVPTLAIHVKSNSPSSCTSDGFKLKFIGVGTCEFVVYTEKSTDYAYHQDIQTASISAARIKPTFVVGSIPNQSSVKLPLTIQGPFIYSPVGLVVPVSSTPSICVTAGSFINILSGGTCTLNYSTPESPNYLASDVYTLTFEITRTPQTISSSLPASLSITSGSVTLSASASSGLPVTFSSQTTPICDVEGNSLKLKKAGSCSITATQGGSATISPVSIIQTISITGPVVAVKKIACVKNGKTKYLQGRNCPKGYAQKK
jgi:hypothetical protein